VNVPPQGSTAGESITALLIQLSQGNRDVEARLAPRVFAELRRAASRYMRRERVNHTLQPSALVNEAWLRLMELPNREWQSPPTSSLGASFVTPFQYLQNKFTLKNDMTWIKGSHMVQFGGMFQRQQLDPDVLVFWNGFYIPERGRRVCHRGSVFP
jgi:hypothetical protein